MCYVVYASGAVTKTVTFGSFELAEAWVYWFFPQGWRTVTRRRSRRGHKSDKPCGKGCIKKSPTATSIHKYFLLWFL
jgi:hypothetical protein